LCCATSDRFRTVCCGARDVNVGDAKDARMVKRIDGPMNQMSALECLLIGHNMRFKDVSAKQQAKKKALLRPFLKDRRVYFCESIHLTNTSASSLFTCGFAGIGIFPQTPLPPAMTFSVSLATAFLSLTYF
jgi:hypothetical protein